MHEIEPYYNWVKYYDSSLDSQSPFHGKEYNYDVYSETIYGYYIDPAWDAFGSETLYSKILFADYNEGYVILEFIGEWNDAINNDIMTLKRGLIEPLQAEGISKFILIGENVMNFHGSDDSYYEEWWQETTEEGGWIVLLGFPDHVISECKKFGIDRYVEVSEASALFHWRTQTPWQVYDLLQAQIQRRLS